MNFYKPKSRIAFDVDGIVLDTATEMWRVFQEAFQLEGGIETWTKYDIGEILGIDTKKLRSFYEPILLRQDLPLLKGAREALLDFYLRTDEPILFITARRSQFVESAVESLAAGLGISKEEFCLYSTTEVHEEEHRNDKLVMLKESNIDFYVEDNPFHWTKYIEAGITIGTLDLPWTKEPAKQNPDVIVYKDWYSLGKTLKEWT